MLTVNQAILCVIIWVVLGLYLGVCVKLFNRDSFKLIDSMILYVLMLTGPVIVIKDFLNEKEDIIDFLVNRNSKGKSQGRRLKAKLMRSKKFAINYIVLLLRLYFVRIPTILDYIIDNTMERREVNLEKSSNQIQVQDTIAKEERNKQNFTEMIKEFLNQENRSKEILKKLIKEFFYMLSATEKKGCYRVV